MADRARQLILALVFLTRLPLGRYLPARVVPLSAAAWAFPLAGALIGAIAGLPLWLAGPGLLAGTLSLALSVWLTGALHEDGLADFADAGGGTMRAERLRIMHDPVIGSYGVMALVLTSLLRVAALATVGPLALIAAAAMARAAIVVAMAALPPARGDGLGQGAGRPGGGPAAAAVLLALAVVLLTVAAGAVGVGPALSMLIAAGAALMSVMARARRLLGGQTGDVLGATSLLVETAALVACAWAGGAAAAAIPAPGL